MRSPGIHGADDMSYFIFRHLWEARQRQDFTSEPLRGRQSSRMKVESGLAMIGNRIVDIRCDPLRVQVPTQCFAILATYDVKVGHVVVSEAYGAPDARVRDLVRISLGNPTPQRIPIVERGQLGGQDRGLDLIEPAVAPVAASDMIFPIPSVLTKGANRLGDVGIASHDRSAVADGTQIL